MRTQILKLAGVKNDSDFYQKFPTEKSFMAKHGAALKKAQMGMKQPKQMPVNISMPNLTAIDPMVSNVGKGAGKFASYFDGIGGGLKNMDAGAVKGLASGIAGGLSGIIGGFNQLKEEKKQIANTNMWGKVSGVVAAAAGSRPQATKKRYARPEDQMVENLNPMGVAGDNFLQAKDGKKIKKAKSGVAQILGGVGSAASAIPGIGTVASIALPLLGDVYDMFVPDKNAEELKKKEEELAINTSFANGQNQVANTFRQYQDSGSVGRNGLSIYNSMSEYRAGGQLQEYTPPSERAMYTGRAEDGVQMAMGGDLQVGRGYAETMSHNPYLPGDGETVMFRGPSHDNGGMPVSFGQNGVEVEGGEPAIKMQDGGQQDNLIVFGNLQMPGTKQKFKHYVADLSKQEAKANKLMDRGVSIVNNNDMHSSFDELSFNSGRAMMIGSDLKLKSLAQKKMDAASEQNAILDTAKEYGIESDALAKGKIKYAKANDPYAEFGGKFSSEDLFQKGGKKSKTAQSKKIGNIDSDDIIIENKNIKRQPPIIPAPSPQARYSSTSSQFPSPIDEGGNYYMPTTQYEPIVSQASSSGFVDPRNAGWDGTNDYQYKGAPAKNASDNNGMSWEDIAKTAYASAYPFLRQKVTNPLDPSQYSAEMLAASLNQEEPVSVQSYSPMLTQPTRVSYQDQLNEITAQTRGAERMTPYNPEAASMIAGQAYGAKNKVLAEQYRMNQGEQARVAEQNRGALNEAQRFNIGQYDQQMVRTSTGKSNTKQQKIEIAKSINEKIQQNRRETREANLMQNMYPGFNFTGNGVAYKDPLYLASLNTNGNGRSNTDEVAPAGYEFKKVLEKIKSSNNTKSTTVTRNGALVKAIKNL